MNNSLMFDCLLSKKKELVHERGEARGVREAQF